MQQRLPIHNMAVSPLAYRKRLFNRTTLKGKGLKRFYCLFVELVNRLLNIDESARYLLLARHSRNWHLNKKDLSTSSRVFLKKGRTAIVLEGEDDIGAPKQNIEQYRRSAR